MVLTIDPEAPSPCGFLSKNAANKRPEYRADAENSSEHGIDHWSSCTWCDKHNDSCRTRKEPCCSQACYSTASNELVGGVGHCTNDGTDLEYSKRYKEYPFDTEEAVELGVK